MAGPHRNVPISEITGLQNEKLQTVNWDSIQCNLLALRCEKLTKCVGFVTRSLEGRWWENHWTSSGCKETPSPRPDLERLTSEVREDRPLHPFSETAESLMFLKWPSSICWQSPLRASLVAQLVENPPAMRQIWVGSLGWEDTLEKGKATCSSNLAWRIPWTMQSMGSQKVRYDFHSLTQIPSAGDKMIKELGFYLT